MLKCTCTNCRFPPLTEPQERREGILIAVGYWAVIAVLLVSVLAQAVLYAIAQPH